jgi:hypothetical protein
VMRPPMLCAPVTHLWRKTVGNEDFALERLIVDSKVKHSIYLIA